MTVAEPIERLGDYPPTLRVVVDGYEEVDEDWSPDQTIMKETRLDTETASWQGTHGDPEALLDGEPDATGTVEALFLRRASW